MNERIRQLAEQAKKYALDAMIKITDKEQALKVYSESYDTKFAELIIKHSFIINNVQTTSRNLPQYNLGMLEGYRRARENMSIVFGVKE